MDIRALMKQAQQMQAKMAKAQEELADQGSRPPRWPAGQVKVVMNGKHQLKSIEIEPEAVDPEDVEFLQDLVVCGGERGRRARSTSWSRRRWARSPAA